jgi:hypothetical protein
MVHALAMLRELGKGQRHGAISMEHGMIPSFRTMDGNEAVASVAYRTTDIEQPYPGEI